MEVTSLSRSAPTGSEYSVSGRPARSTFTAESSVRLNSVAETQAAIAAFSSSESMRPGIRLTVATRDAISTLTSRVPSGAGERTEDAPPSSSA